MFRPAIGGVSGTCSEVYSRARPQANIHRTPSPTESLRTTRTTIVRLRRIAQQYSTRLEECVSKHTRIARELDETLSQSFHEISLLFYSLSEEILGECRRKDQTTENRDLAA